MGKFTADQIIERIANGAEPEVMRLQIEQALQNIIVDTTRPHSFVSADLFPGGKPTVAGGVSGCPPDTINRVNARTHNTKKLTDHIDQCH